MYEGADADVLTVAGGKLAMFFGAVQRGSLLNVPQGLPILTAHHQRAGEKAMADQQRPRSGARLSQGQKFGRVVACGFGFSVDKIDGPKPVKHREMLWLAGSRGLRHQPTRALQDSDHF